MTCEMNCVLGDKFITSVIVGTLKENMLLVH